METLKVTTIYQPWATLLLLKSKFRPGFAEKRFETRSYPVKHKGLLGIHSGMETKYMDLFYEKPFIDVFKRHGITSHEQLPLGYLMGVVELTGCKQIVLKINKKSEFFYRIEQVPDTDYEFAFGDWKLGRFAWCFKEPKFLSPIVRIEGQRGLWDYNYEEELNLK